VRETPLFWIQFIPQGPGPPHRPHPPDGNVGGFDSDATANTLKFRAVFPDPHSGHLTLAVELIDFTSVSKLFLQDLHVYS
jgi:hypothetical protein